MARLGYNYENDRYGILEHDLWVNEGLHCGDCVEILIDGEWIQDRIEYDHNIEKWILAKSGLKGEELEFVKVKGI